MREAGISYKNSELANIFNVSNTTIANWIDDSVKGLNDLKLIKVGKRNQVLKTESNITTIRNLIQKGRKHVPKSKVSDTIKASEEIYKIFNEEQLAEIFCSLSSKHEIPYKFSYFDKGAVLWNENYLYAINDPERSKNKESKLIHNSLLKITSTLKGFKKINVIDIGCGNGMPSLPIIDQLISEGFEVDYYAIDISKKMIEIDEAVITKKYPKINFNFLVSDFEKNNLCSLLLEIKKDASTANLLMFLGGTLGNHTHAERIFGNLRESMTANDFLLIGNAVADENANVSNFPANEFQIKRTIFILDLLGLKKYYSVNTMNQYDRVKREEYRKVQIDKNVEIKIKINKQEKVLSFNRFDEILVYRYFRYKELELVEEVLKQGFSIELFNTNNERTYALLMVCTRL